MPTVALSRSGTRSSNGNGSRSIVHVHTVNIFHPTSLAFGRHRNPPLPPLPHPDMGFLSTVVTPLAYDLVATSKAALLIAAFTSVIVLAIVLNVLKQLLFRNPTEPPIVFHWIPFIGSTITYGIDPYKFFFSCREKVSSCRTFLEGFGREDKAKIYDSMATSSRSSCWARRRQCAWVPKAMISSSMENSRMSMRRRSTVP